VPKIKPIGTTPFDTFVSETILDIDKGKYLYIIQKTANINGIRKCTIFRTEEIKKLEIWENQVQPQSVSLYVNDASQLYNDLEWDWEVI